MSAAEIIVAPLDGLDAVAQRTGADVLIHISPAVPESIRDVVADYLCRAVRFEPDQAATMELPLGQAVMLASRRPLPRSRRRVSKARVVAAAAMGFVLPAAGLFAAAALYGGGQQSSSSSTALPDPYTRAWPSKPNPHPQAISAGTATADTPTWRAVAEVAAPSSSVSIHPPQRITRAAPVQIGPPDTTPEAQPERPRTLSAPDDDTTPPTRWHIRWHPPGCEDRPQSDTPPTAEDPEPRPETEPDPGSDSAPSSQGGSPSEPTAT